MSRQSDAVVALLLGAAAWAGAGAPAQAQPHALAARLHARQLHLDPLAAAASVALADIWLALGAEALGPGPAASSLDVESPMDHIADRRAWAAHGALAGYKAAAVSALALGPSLPCAGQAWRWNCLLCVLCVLCVL